MKDENNFHPEKCFCIEILIKRNEMKSKRMSEWDNERNSNSRNSQVADEKRKQKKKKMKNT